MSLTMEYTEQLMVTHCWCGIALAIPQNLYRGARDNGQSVYCPLGHSFSWHETEADKLRKRLEEQKAETARFRDQARAERELHNDTARRLAAQRGETTKARKRAAAAVCPCCNRSFVQLRRHMASKHPDYTPGP